MKLPGSLLQHGSIHDEFERRAAAHPNAIAIQSETAVWRYSKLSSVSDQIASALLAAGIRRETPVGVCTSRSPEMIAGMLGILKAGGAYLPIDPSYPAQRTSAMLADTQLKYLIADEQGLGKLRPVLTGSEFILNPADLQGSTAARVTGKPEDLAYVMYTSGSTGTPKGVMIEHRGILRLVLEPNYMDISSKDVFLQLAPMSFDASTFEIWGALLNGARLVLIDTEKPSLAEIAQVITEHKVTVLWLTAGLFHALMDEYPSCIRQLKYLLAGGDVLSPRHVSKALDHLENGVLINGYGPTEVTTFTACHRITRADLDRPSIPIGRPINATEVHILGEDGVPVPADTIGELYIGGAGVARGYWNRPELTAASFIEDPFSDDAQARLYRSGDLVHSDSDNVLHFHGRADMQVKIRGFRIELGEIEHHAALCPGVREACVIAKNTTSGDKRLTCFYVSAAGETVAPEDVQSFLEQKLPAYMLPTEFIGRAELPLNPSGKVDRKLLATEEAAFRASGAVKEQAATSLEQELTGMVESVLLHPGIGLDDDFFKLGGNSLMAARLFAQIDKKLGKKLPLATIIEASTVRRLAKLITDDNWVAPWSSLVPLKETGGYAPLFLVHAIGGNVLGYRELAWSLDERQPVYALQAQGLNGSSSTANSVEEMAAHYIRAIKTVQPTGPYYLGGWSAGGRLAFEMSRQLTLSGESVAYLAIFDTHIGVTQMSGRRVHQLASLLRWNAHDLRQVGLREFARKKTWNLGIHLRIAAFEARKRLRRNANPKALPAKAALIRAVTRYKPSLYTGDISVFKTADAAYYSNGDPQLGWQTVTTGRVSICEVPGNHDTLFRPPHLLVLATELQRQLDCARLEAESEELLISEDTTEILSIAASATAMRQ
jgi:amino acid adenylation domain-containing protein